MKHLIIVKFKDDIHITDDFVKEIEMIFEKSLEIDGVHGVKLNRNVIELPNRYDLMIEVTMEMESLKAFDSSEVHRVWKESFSKYIQSKVIFDY